jgi:hypothetical protein
MAVILAIHNLDISWSSLNLLKLIWVIQWDLNTKHMNIRTVSILHKFRYLFLAIKWSNFCLVMKGFYYFWLPACFSHLKAGQFCQVFKWFPFFSRLVHSVQFTNGQLSDARF